MLRLIPVATVLYSYFLIRTNLAKLPRCIPTHFNAMGEANGWGSPDTLWTLLGVQILTTVVFLAVPYIGQKFPQTVNLGRRRLSDYTPEQQLRLLPLLHDMMGYVCIIMNLFFVFMLRQLIHLATDPHPHMPMAWPMGLLLGSTLGVTLYYLRRIRRAAEGSSGD